MARQGQYWAETYEAENDLSNYQYLFVEINASTGQVDLPDTLGDVVVGVLLNDPGALQAASVAVAGLVKVKAGATIAAGDKITTSTSGTGIVANSGSVWVAGHAESAVASGGYFTMQIKGYVYV